MADDIPVTVPLPPAPVAQLACALAKAQAAFTVPTKGHTAKVKMKAGGEYSYRYSTLDDLIDATRPHLTANGLAVMQDVEVSARGVNVWTVIMHESGEQWRSRAVALAVGGDGRPQDVGSAITYARRYSMGAALNVAADEDDDAAGAQHAEKPKAQQKPREQGTRPQAVERQQQGDAVIVTFITEAQRKRLYTVASNAGWKDAEVKVLLNKYGYASSKDIAREDYDAIVRDLEAGAEVPA